MRRKSFFSILVALAATITMSAQDNSQEAKSGGNKSSYQRLSVSFNNLSTSYDGGAGYESTFFGKAENLAGLSVGFLNGWKLTDRTPLYLETGVQATLNKGKHLRSYKTYNKGTHTFLYAEIPVNVAYKFKLGAISIDPYLGLHVRGYFVGEEKRLFNDEHIETINFFSNSDLKQPANRFSTGAQIGVGGNINAYYVGIGYSFEFGNFLTNKLSNVTVSVGYNF